MQMSCQLVSCGVLHKLRQTCGFGISVFGQLDPLLLSCSYLFQNIVYTTNDQNALGLNHCKETSQKQNVAKETFEH